MHESCRCLASLPVAILIEERGACPRCPLGFDGTEPGKSKCTPHGFRANATSILNEAGFNPDAVERQMAHMERNTVRAAYIHRARYLDERKERVQWWADFLDGSKEKGKLLPIKWRH